MYIYSWVSVHVMYQPKTEAHVILNLKKLGWAKTPEPSKIANLQCKKITLYHMIKNTLI